MYKTTFKYCIAAVFSAMLFAACSNDDVAITPTEPKFNGDKYGELVVGSLDPETFTLDSIKPISEVERIPAFGEPHYEDFVENWFKDLDDADDNVNVVTLTFTENDVTVDKTKNLSITKNGANIVIKSEKKRIYRLTGNSSNGSFKVYSDKKFGIILDNIKLSNPNGAVINIQKGPTLGEKKRCFIMIHPGTENVLTDGEVYNATPEGEDEKGCIFSEGKIIFSLPDPANAGSADAVGTLMINANGKNGIASDDYVYFHKYSNITVNAKQGDGIKTNDGIFIGGGILKINLKGDAAKGLNTEKEIVVNGGRTAVINDGKAIKTDAESSNSTCVKSDSIITISAGELIGRSKESMGSIGIYSKGNIEITGGGVSIFSFDDAVRSTGTVTKDDKKAHIYLKSTNGKSINEGK